LKEVKTAKGDFAASSLAAVVNTSNRNELIVKEYIHLANGEKTICFCVNIDHCEALTKEFQKNNINAVSVHGKISRGEREKIIRNFKEGEITILVNCYLLTEGFDEPSVTCLLLARPTMSKVLYMQMIGRGSRIFPGKTICKVIEFTDNNYDVSNIEEIIFPSRTHTITRNRIRNGEKISDYYKSEKAIFESTGYIEVEKFKVIQPSFYYKLATNWQKKFLEKMKIEFAETITEYEANNLIMKLTN
jgi:superfamily II DNA or RNA helicase